MPKKVVPGTAQFKSAEELARGGRGGGGGGGGGYSVLGHHRSGGENETASLGWVLPRVDEVVSNDHLIARLQQH